MKTSYHNLYIVITTALLLVYTTAVGDRHSNTTSVGTMYGLHSTQYGITDITEDGNWVLRQLLLMSLESGEG